MKQVLSHIAAIDGLLYTKWGPCFCKAPEEKQDCSACANANEIESQGLDYEEEYQKWRAGK